MLTIVKLTDAEYVLSAVASGLEDYYMGIGEAPGVWRGRGAGELGLEGVVEGDDLRAVVDGRHPGTRVDLLAANRARKVRAFDITLSAPKSVSLLWAFGPPDVATVAAHAHVEAASLALDLLESKVAVARVQHQGVRTRVETSGLAIATFVHRVSREGDPGLHTHNVTANVVRRPDGTYCALDAAPLHWWAKAVGCVYQEQLRRILTRDLGVEWGPDRNGTREMVGFEPAQLRAFSKRSVQIEAYMEQSGQRYESPAARMRADEAASLATRRHKQAEFTPELLRERWAAEAEAVGIGTPDQLRDRVCGRALEPPRLDAEEVLARLLDPEEGLCAHDSRFGEAQVTAAVAAMGGGRLDVARIEELTGEFLASPHVVRLVERQPAGEQRRPPQWSTVAQRELEDRVLGHLERLTQTTVRSLEAATVDAALAGKGLGPDQESAVRTLCSQGPALRSLISPAGFGKTTAVHAGATAAAAEDRPVVGVATTNVAVAELIAAGIPALTIARLRIELEGRALAPNTVVILDEASQTSTADAEVVLAAVADTPGAQLWALGDVRQAQAVRAGGLAAEIDRLGRQGDIPAPALTENRRQLDPTERRALAAYRTGDVAASQAIRTDAGWEHSHDTPAATRDALAAAAVADADAHGPAAVAVLAVSHADCEDLADRIRAIRAQRGELAGPTMSGPGWGKDERSYAAGDRVLLHAPAHRGGGRLHNGTIATVAGVDDDGMRVATDDGREAVLARSFVGGCRREGTPNLSHAWARTVDGAQGGTWAQVHLLGTAALDNFTAYVGQSRSRLATHTWNVARVIEADYGGALADRRTPEQEVLAAMERAPLKTFAATDDPWVLHRQLSAELAEHQSVIATRPRDASRGLQRANRELARAGEQLRGAHSFYGDAVRRLEAIGPVSRLRRDGRRDHQRANEDLERADERLAAAQEQLSVARRNVIQLERGAAERAQWDRQHGWRLGEVSRIRNELHRHWAGAVLAVVREGDPLAFGIDRLRAARATYAADLRARTDALPPDRSPHLRRARADLAKAERAVGDAWAALMDAEEAYRSAGQRRWGRRDRDLMTATSARLDRARDGVGGAEDQLSRCRQAVAGEGRAVDDRQSAMAATAPERQRLEAAVAELDDALDQTRPQRVLEMATAAKTPERLHAVLGPLPTSRGGRAVWLALAEEIEADPDRAGGRQSERAAPGAWRWPASVDHRPDLVDMGSRLDPTPAGGELPDPATWAVRLEEAGVQLQRLPAIERHVGLSISL